MMLSFFRNHQIAALPVDPFAIAEAQRIFLLGYSEYSRATHQTVLQILSRFGSDGFTVLTGQKNVIVYNDCNPTQRIRWTLTHELCHIFLGHIKAGGEALGRSAEVEADRLTASVLCPLPVVHLCGVAAPRELALLTGLSAQASSYQFQKLQIARSRATVFREQEDYETALHFMDFISAHIAAKTMGGKDADVFCFDADPLFEK